MCCLLSYKQSCDMGVLSVSVRRQWTGWQEQDGEVAAGRFHVFSGSSTLRSHPSMPTTRTCCHGDEDVYFALSFIKAYHPDMLSWWSGRLLRPHFHQGLHSDILPWWWGRLLCPHFHQGLARYHPVMLLWWWYHRHWTLPWMSTRLSPWHVVMVIGWSMSPSLSSRMTTLTCCHGDVVTHTGHSSVYRPITQGLCWKCCHMVMTKLLCVYILQNYTDIYLYKYIKYNLFFVQRLGMPQWAWTVYVIF